MALRIVEIVVNPGSEKTVKEAVKDLDVQDLWFSRPNEERLTARMLVKAEDTEKLVDALNQRFGVFANFRVVIIPVEATIPRIEEKPKEEPENVLAEAPPEENNKKRWIKRISRDELHNEVQDSAELTTVYAITISLSVLVAAIGLLKDNVAVVIGAMVIAPLLGPNVAMSLATVLGDSKMLRRSAMTLAAGVCLAMALSLIIGMIFEVDPTIREISLRTEIGLTDIVLALASGAAGALFFTIGTSTALVGVMVAVALLPPLVTLGMLIGSGHIGLAFDTLLLFMTNFICVNLAAVGVFVSQGIKPSHWWESLIAKKSVSYSLIVWMALLVIMVVLILLYS